MKYSPATIEDKLSSLLDDRDFQEIDARFRNFNLFSALGAVRGELRHSNFLAFLLSPSQSHGLGADILGRALRLLLSKCKPETRRISSLELILADLDTTIVEREQDNIDILIEIAPLRLVVAVENKVRSSVSDGQLTRYKELVQRKYKGWQQQLFVLLTPEAYDPEPYDSDYIACGYGEIADLLNKYLEERRNSLSGEVALILSHYVEMIRGDIVDDEKRRELARQLYFRHQDAFDFILDTRPQPGSALEPVRKLIEGDPSFVLDRPSPRIVRFALSDWKSEHLNSCPPERWTKSKRNLLFELQAHGSSARVNISLILGPGEEPFRKHIYSEASQNPKVFIGLVKPMGLRTSTIYSRDLRSAHAADDLDEADKDRALEAAWREFVGHDLLSLKTEINKFVASYADQTSQSNGGVAQ